MKYTIKKPYNGTIVSGDQVDFAAGEVFDSSEDFIIKGDMLICRIDSEFFKEYFAEEDIVVDSDTSVVAIDSDTSIAEEIAVASDTLTQLSMTMDSLEAI